ncbi:hypothetical protein E4U17_007353 [Claviceps sp. LM77 group G4]|nr:hypothetical protein E4U17_007353 [Claviceps sp. LM77 group G4]KAG6057934.1 hypothetical protein E4U33_007384 [Claviceps sp. LM78 group G4]KAG6070017.1 hypothetical protein E4U16_007211 [Claviceps sp. LM84 group G4]
MPPQKKPYSAVTVTIENLTAESCPLEDLSGVPDLVEVIKLQATGPIEAARAIRKKLKYGTVHRQIRSLVLLDALIQNAGSTFQRSFADEPLLERLRVCGTSDLSNQAVRNKCADLFYEWAKYAKTPGLERVARLHRELPKRKVAITQERSKVIQETNNPFGDDEEEEEAEERARALAQRQEAVAPSSSSASAAPAAAPNPKAQDVWSRMAAAMDGKTKKSSSSASKSGSGHKTRGNKSKPFNFDKEKDKMSMLTAEAIITSAALMDCLEVINREAERVSENPTAFQHFTTCRILRRKLLRYIYLVENEEWLARVLLANDKLVLALMAYEQLDRSIEADSDSDDELAEQAHRYRMMTEKAQQDREAGGHVDSRSQDVGSAEGTDASAPPKPSRPAVPPRRPHAPPTNDDKHDDDDDDYDDDDDDDDDDENPFGDKNFISTPSIERDEPRWQ